MASPITIVIAGGGSAGWMTAAAFARFLPQRFRITLVESEEIGTVGVGEATIPQLHLFNGALGIDEDRFVRETQATFKLGIEFAGWGAPGERYMHAFGDVGRDFGSLPFHHSWLRGRRERVAKPLAQYALNNMAALANCMQRGASRTAPVLPTMPYAFHFDAGLYAAFLRRYAEAGGVVRVEGRVADVERTDGGDLAALLLADGRRIAGDLFVDCTGFRALLIEGAMGAGFEDWSHWLPCDRAIAVPSDRATALTPYTRATAHGAGWQWRIPLQHRTGNGIVYASAHLSDEQAERTLLANLDTAAVGEPRRLRFVAGRRRAMWKGNVIAVGLSSGFLEPLESTSIHLIQSAIERIVKLLPGRGPADALRAEYNRQAANEYERIRDFLIHHYAANAREEPFWRERREAELPPTLAHRIALWRESGQIVREAGDLFTEVAWLQVLVGQGILPTAHHPLADQPPLADIAEYLTLLEQLIAREVAQMSTHDAFVARHCAAPARAAA